MKTGRNEPCPCGSGKKYKRCCMPGDEHLQPESLSLKEAMLTQEFESIEHAQAFAEQHIERSNNAAREDLNGYSPNQLQQLLTQPLEAQKLIRWRGTLTEAQLEHSPIFALFQFLKSYSEVQPCKATPKGNFSVSLVKDAWCFFKDKFPKAADVERIYSVNREDKFRELHILRIVLQESGLLRKHNGEFKLTQKALKASPDELFQLLFEGYAFNYNWAYEDGYPEEPFFQESIFYALVELNKTAQRPIEKREFSDSFINTFPMATQHFSHDGYGVASDYAKNAYELRLIERFLAFFGFLELLGAFGTKAYKSKIETRPLLNEAFEFK